MNVRRPPAEVTVDSDLARRLLESQHPGFLSGDVSLSGEGWDNFVFRVGERHALRIPRREVGVGLLENEQRWLPEVAARVLVRVPAPVAVGVPSTLFRWPWSVVEWIPGTTAEGWTPSTADAERLATTLRALHEPAPPGAPTNPYRGVPMEERRVVVQERLPRLGLEGVTPLWRRALAAPPAETRVWLHGDLHPKNVLIREGALSGLIDWGDMTGGDPATDLACMWTLLDTEARVVFARTYAPSEAERCRAIGWAVHFASAMLDSGEPEHVRMGRVTLERLADEL